MSKERKQVTTIRSSAAEYLTFVASTGNSETSVEMRYENENIWLTQKMMATLYDVSVSAINQHLKRIFSDNELTREATIKKYLIVQTEGSREVSREIEHYSLQAIITDRADHNKENMWLTHWDREVLQDTGRVTAEIARAHAESELEKYRIIQDRLFESDFDKMLKKIEAAQNGGER